MKREYAYIAVAVVLALFLVAVSLSEPGELTGRVVDGNLTNETTNETLTNQTQETTNETTNETVINQTTETINQTINETLTNQTTETINQTINETLTNQTTDQQTDTTTTTTQTDTTTQDSDLTGSTVEEDIQEETTNQTEPTVENQTNQTVEIPPVESEVDRIIRELEEQGVLEGSQPPEPEDLSPITGGVVQIGNETCQGCLLKDECYESNDRKKRDYCFSDGTWIAQKAFDETCSNNFECRSNLCVEEKCTRLNIIKVIIDWLKNLLGIE